MTLNSLLLKARRKYSALCFLSQLVTHGLYGLVLEYNMCQNKEVELTSLQKRYSHGLI